jgi:hypothetical protein
VTTETKTTCDGCGKVCPPNKYFASVLVTPGSESEVPCACKHACSKDCIVAVLWATAQKIEDPNPGWYCTACTWVGRALTCPTRCLKCGVEGRVVGCVNEAIMKLHDAVEAEKATRAKT